MSAKSTKGLESKLKWAMARFGEKRRWKALILLSSEGYTLARYGKTKPYSEDMLLEFAFSLNETAILLDGSTNAKEITLQANKGSRIILRYFTAWNESMVLIAVCAGKWGYKRAMDRLIEYINKLA
jgi:hypothetical protein